MLNLNETFAEAIKDSENLLAHFNALNSHPPPAELEVLKRAGLIMAMTAWETYVEDRLQELTTERLEALNDPTIVNFVRGKLNEELKRLHNPDSAKTIGLFRDFTGIDVESWWDNVDPEKVKERLDSYLKLRGDVVHRSRVSCAESSNSHPVTKDDLEKAIKFLKRLVDATERAIESQRKCCVPPLQAEAVQHRNADQ